MGKNSGIEWTDHTFNPWWGCVKVSEGCAHCYAETFSRRLGMDVWGRGKPRRFFDDRHWNDPVKWNLAAEKSATGPWRVFCSSMADVFEDALGLGEQRARLYALIESTPHLEWLLLTKREEELQLMLPTRWKVMPPRNVRLGVTVENQKWARRRMRRLLLDWRGKNFLSLEPMLGEISLADCMIAEKADWESVNDLQDGDEEPERFIGESDWNIFEQNLVHNPEHQEWEEWRERRVRLFALERSIHWVIVGGESGASCRPMEEDWAMRLVNECKAAKVPVFVKQLGGHPDKRDRMEEFPTELQVREFPE